MRKFWALGLALIALWGGEVQAACTAASSTGGGMNCYCDNNAIPVDVKSSSAPHNGNFGGYAGLRTWMNANGCAGYVMCSTEDVFKYAASAGNNSFLTGGNVPHFTLNGDLKQIPTTRTNCDNWTASDTLNQNAINSNLLSVANNCSNPNTYVACCKFGGATSSSSSSSSTSSTSSGGNYTSGIFQVKGLTAAMATNVGYTAINAACNTLYTGSWVASAMDLMYTDGFTTAEYAAIDPKPVFPLQGTTVWERGTMSPLIQLASALDQYNFDVYHLDCHDYTYGAHANHNFTKVIGTNATKPPLAKGATFSVGICNTTTKFLCIAKK